MRVGVNLFEFFSPGSRGEGVLNYVRGLLRGLSEIDHNNTYILFLNRLNREEFPRSCKTFEHFVVPLDPRKKWARVLWEQVFLPVYIRKFRLDVIHCPSGTASVLPLRKCVVTYHAANVFFYYNSQFKKHALGLKQIYIAAMERFVISRAAAIITDSHYSKQDMINQLKVKAAKIGVVHLTVPYDDNGTPNASAPDFPYILDVTSSAVHKNLNVLISAYALLKQRVPSLPKLVIAGAIPEQAAWGMYPRRDLEQKAFELGVGEDVVIVPYPARDCLIALYRHAQLFVFPSLFEGFGLAPLEAMKYGLPVVLSDRASLPEVGGDAAIYVDPENPAEVADAIERVLSDSRLRQALIERGHRRVESFGTWRRVAQETLAVYEQALEAQKN